MVTIFKKTIDEKKFLSELILNESENRKNLFENLEYFLSNNGYIKEIVQTIYEIESSVLKTENDKEIKVLLLNFLSVIFLFKDELEKKLLLEKRVYDLSVKNEELKSRFDSFVDSIGKQTDLILSNLDSLEIENDRQKSINSKLENELQSKEESLEIALETVYELNQRISELTQKNEDLILRISKIKKSLEQIAEKKIKERSKDYLEILERDLRKKLRQELELKKILLEAEVEKINNTFKISLSAKELKISELNQLVEFYKDKVSDLEQKLLKKTNENVDLILEQTQQIFNQVKEKTIEEAEIDKLKALLEKERMEKEELKSENKELKKQNRELSLENKQLEKENKELKNTIVKVS